METLPEKKDLTLAQQLAISTRTENNPELQAAIISSLATTIEESIRVSKPVAVLVREGGSMRAIEQTLALMITKAATMLSVFGNLKDEHPMEISKMLLTEFPTCSLDDFQIMLKRGIMGKYGEVKRFDVSVVFHWAEEFIREWAEEMEKYQVKEKKKQIVINTDTIENSDKTKSLVSKFIEDLSDFNKIPSVTEKDLRANGKEDPPRKQALTVGREEFVVGETCEVCDGQGCDACGGIGKINAIKVQADSEEEAVRMYENSKRKKLRKRSKA